MLHRLLWMSGGCAPDVKGKILGTIAVLALANLAAWGWALIALREYPLLLGTALLAYGFGLRHAMDADHLAAIDNVTRKLMQEGQRPVTVGLHFSLGHSTVVWLATAAVAGTASALNERVADLKELGEIVGTSVSAAFLLAIAAINLVVLVAVHRTFRAVRRGERVVEDDLNVLLASRGLLGRFFRPLFRLISKSWHMYPLGFLFGLGFETATEIALLGIASVEAAKGLSAWSILVFPALFTAGMSLVDTLDGVLMLGAYGWAFIKPVRKLYYNMTITFISLMVALVVGGIEALGLMADRLNLEGGFWALITAVNANFGALGYLIIGIFGIGWVISAIAYRANRYDEIEIAGD
jgi:nickel/cobalt transporter (NiCoT) family protein